MPVNFFLLTFTNKELPEMRHRIESLAGLEARITWHGNIFTRSLQRSYEWGESGKIGYPSNFTILRDAGWFQISDCTIVQKNANWDD